MDLVDIEINESYWESIEIQASDLEFIYSYLLENEIPLPSDQLAEALITERIRLEKENLEQKQREKGDIFLPEQNYSVGDKVQFPALRWANGKVTDVREGKNPEYPGLKVISVEFENGKTRQFATNIENHILNKAVAESTNLTEADAHKILEAIGDVVTRKLEDQLEENHDLVRIGAKWFPKSLLIDFNEGHLNLAEAVLDMHAGGPLAVDALLEQIDVESDDPQELVEFSLNYALQKDARFDEVGPSGVVQWFLNRLEPDYVREKPVELVYEPEEFDRSLLDEDMLQAEQNIDDEYIVFNQEFARKTSPKEISITLNYPHWRIGCIPLTPYTKPFFPTAYESPRVKFRLIDPEGDKISAWVVRPFNYVYGLKDWFDDLELMPGSIIKIKPGKVRGEVLVQPHKKRSNREWIRTLLIGADGGVVFAMLKQTITADFNERMAVAVPSTEVLDELWQKRAHNPMPLKKVVLSVMTELAKLNPQGHVHAVELYAALNCIKRCPPGHVFSILASEPEFSAVGDLYFRLNAVS